MVDPWDSAPSDFPVRRSQSAVDRSLEFLVVGKCSQWCDLTTKDVVLSFASEWKAPLQALLRKAKTAPELKAAHEILVSKLI